MNFKTIGAAALICLGVCAVSTPAPAQSLPKAAVAQKIAQVENGVDEFRNYLEHKGENARNTASAAQASGAQPKGGRAGRRGGGQASPETRQAAAQQGKDELNDALDALNHSTNRLRRKFDATDKWMETKVQVEAVLDDGRRINQAVTRGNYGSQVAKLWATLRNAINDLARAYNLTPLGA